MQRNPQNSTRNVNVFDGRFNKGDNMARPDYGAKGDVLTCGACKTEIPLKPGFRVSSLKCPKCGKPCK